jgi:hypothetical protein
MKEPRFSDRIGVTEVPTTIQVGTMSGALRNSLWNLILAFIATEPPYRAGLMWHRIVRLVAQHYYKVAIDTVPLWNEGHAVEWLRKQYADAEWWDVYNLAEFLVRELGDAAWFPKRTAELEAVVNTILEDELAGYRFVDGVLAPIASAPEVAAIEEAIEAARRHGLTGVHLHVTTALEHLGKKPTPDYRNSIKESISAVESAARQISGANSLGEALAAIQKVSPFHGALQKGFLSLYGYTSDDDGIRHAILDEPTVGFDEAKYMLVSCSAFASFLMSKVAAAGRIKKS